MPYERDNSAAHNPLIRSTQQLEALEARASHPLPQARADELRCGGHSAHRLRAVSCDQPRSHCIAINISKEPDGEQDVDQREARAPKKHCKRCWTASNN